MTERLTVGELKKILKEYKVPDDAIITCWSDEEGNSDSVCCSAFPDIVGRKEIIGYNSQKKPVYYTIGEEVMGIDLKKDKGKTILTFRPLY
jgi:hypothetical protein